ncbi:MAG: MYG1 family protein [Bacillota bacterium]|nr:MYG1 family protein [Bacillota bacterium]
MGTHDGRFHADEVMATAILKQIFDVELTRTRDSKVLNELDIVYDVGGGEFDHHGLEKVYRDDEIPFAACGLIWREFGKDVVRFKEPALDDSGIESILNYVDRVLMEGIDALDNGVRIGEDGIPLTHISSIISGFNTPWYLEEDENQKFNEAVELSEVVLVNTINRKLSVIKARDNIIKAYESREIPQVLVLDEFCPWGEALQDIDKEDEVLFIVYPRKDGYALQTVRVRGEDKKKLPKSWAGKRDEELAAVTSVPDAVFCHSARFMAVTKSFQGIMKFAKLALDEPVEVKKVSFFEFIKRMFFKR